MASRTNGNPTDLLRLQQQPSRPTSGPGLLSWGDVAYCYTEATVIIAAIAYFAKPTITHCDNFIVLLGETTRLLIQLMILRWSPLAIWTSSYPFIRIIYYLGRFLCVGGTTHEAESDPIVYRFGAIRPSSSTGLISFYLNTAEGNARLFAFFAGSACSILRMMWEKDKLTKKEKFWRVFGPYLFAMKIIAFLLVSLTAVALLDAIVEKKTGIQLLGYGDQEGASYEAKPSVALILCFGAWVGTHSIVAYIKGRCLLRCYTKDCDCAYGWIERDEKERSAILNEGKDGEKSAFLDAEG